MGKEKKITKLPKHIEETDIVDHKEYIATLASIKKEIQNSQLKAITSVNKELIRLYWNIGKTIAERQSKSGWGTSVIEKLAKDLQIEFPGIEGFSRPNVFKMKSFFAAYEKVSQAVRQLEELPIFDIPWGHNILLITKLKDNKERLWYASKTVEHGWSRNILTHWIKSDLYHREGKAITNFTETLPALQSDLAQQTLKDPYIFDFLTLHEDHTEKDLEEGLITNMQKLLMELGKGLAFVGRQYPITVGEKTLYIDLLFYHLKLRCYFIVELKTKEFDGRDAGQMSVYLSAVDDLLKHEYDNPTYGMILCKTKDNVFVEYALRNFNRPMGVAGYEIEGYKTQLTKSLPKELKSSLPTIEEIEEELEKGNTDA